MNPYKEGYDAAWKFWVECVRDDPVNPYPNRSIEGEQWEQGYEDSSDDYDAWANS